MESIAETKWDVVIAGTGLAQSLLALALSRSNKKVLHVDANEYYGGAEAALSLQDAEDWVKQVQNGEASPVFAEAKITQRNSDNGESPGVLGYSRAYSLALAPQVIYMRSAFLSTLVSSRIFRQLEFMAVGSWFVYDKAGATKMLKKIPNSREDVFADKNMGMKAKRSLISFQRLFRDPEEQAKVIEEHGKEPLDKFLLEQYSLPSDLQQAVNALTLSADPPSRTRVEFALPRIARHVTSMGVSGAGFSAVVPKWGGLAEIVQAACRAQAVGGGVYMLGKGIKNVVRDDEGIELTLTDDIKIQAALVAGNPADLGEKLGTAQLDLVTLATSISIVSHTFDDLFARLAEDGPLPVVAIVSFPAGSISYLEIATVNPIALMIHSSETGECPRGQSVIYASTVTSGKETQDQVLLQIAVERLLEYNERTSSDILWTLSYHRLQPAMGQTSASNFDTGPVVHLSESGLDPVFDDSVLDRIRTIWRKVTGAEDGFMAFEDREAGAYDDDDDDDEKEDVGGSGGADGENEI